jgi:hypothetical protein
MIKNTTTIKTSLYTNCKAKKNNEVSLLGVLRTIEYGDYKNLVEELEKITNKKERQEYKANNFPGFTWSATFKDGHNLKNIKDYNQIVGLDYDEVNNLEELKNKALMIDSTFAAFISPSGNGLKVLVKVNSTLEDHKEAFRLVDRHYNEFLNITSDPSVKDPTRLCYVSYDPNIYVNEDSLIFDVNLAKELEKKTDINLDTLFKKSLLTFREGNRHFSLVSCAGLANRYGIDKQLVHNYFSPKSDATFGLDEIESTINDVYNRYSHQFNTAISKRKDLTNFKQSLSTDNWFNIKGQIVYQSLINDLSSRISYIPDIGRIFAKSDTGIPVFKDSDMNMSYEDFYFFLYDKGAKMDEGKYKKLLNSDKIDKINPLTIFYLMVKETKWDGEDRISMLIDGMNILDNNEQLKRLLTKYFYTIYAFGLRGIDKELPKDSFSRVSLILYSQKRGTGKTSFLRMLGMDGKIEEWTGIEGLEIYCQYAERPGQDKDDFDNNKSSKLIINFDDIQDFLIQSGGHLRSIISEDTYSQRKKYSRNSKTYKRRSAFTGTTNHEEIMNDNDENRYLIINIAGFMDFKLFESLDMLQFWAQVRNNILKLGKDSLLNNEDNENIRLLSLKYMYNSNSDEILCNYFVFDPAPAQRLSYPEIEEIMKRNGHYFKGNDLGNALKKLAPPNMRIKKKSGDNYYYLVSIKDDLMNGGATFPNRLSGGAQHKKDLDIDF